MTRTRICFIVFGFPPEYSGATLHALEFGEFLKAKGCDLIFLSHCEQEKLAGQSSYNGYRVVRFVRRLDAQKNLSKYHLRLMLRLLRLRREFDIIYLNGNPGQFWTPFYVILFGKLFKKKVFVELNMEYKPDPLCIKGTRFASLKSWVATLAAGYVSLSSAITQSLKAQHLPQHLLIHSPNGVNTERFKPLGDDKEKRQLRQRLGLPPDKKILITVGAIVKRKGIDFLLDVFKDVVCKHDNVLFVLIGPYEGFGVDEPFAQQMRASAQTKSLRDKVWFKGSVENVQEYLQASDIFVFAGRQEGSPNSIREAMACGLPAISLHLSGCTGDMIDSGANGFLIDVTNKQELEDYTNHEINDRNCKQQFVGRVIEVLRTPELRGSVGKRAAGKIVQTFSMRKRAEFLASVMGDST